MVNFRSIVSFLPLYLAAAMSSASPSYGPWHHSVIGGGGYIQNVVLCPSDPKRAYAYVDNSGIFRSDDGARSWRIIHGGLPVSFGIYDVRGLVVDPRDANRIVAAIGGQWDKPWGLFVSGDGGGTWKQTLTANIFGSDEFREAGFILDRHPQRPDELTVATGGTGVFRSDDNGGTWQKLGMEGVYPTDLRYDRSKPARLWLCAQPMKMRSGLYPTPMSGGFHRSEDGGATWKKLGDTSPSEILQDPVDAARLYGIFEDTRIRTSTDGGATWSDLSQGLDLAAPGQHPIGNHPLRYTALAAGRDFVLTASAMGQFYRLNPERSAWQKIERQGLEEKFDGQEWFASRARGVHGHFGSALGSITIDPSYPDRWFFTDFYAIYQTTDAGRSWALSCDGVDATVLFGLTQDPADPGVVHLAMADNGFFLSQDGGARFLRPDTGNQNTMSISVSRSRPARVYAVGSGLIPELAGMKAAQVWVSTDRGQTWVASPMAGLPPMADRFAGTIAADPNDPYTAWLTVSGTSGPNDGGVYRTRDGGRSWEWIGGGLPEKNWFFRTHPWGGGRQLAVGQDGSLVAIGSAGIFRLAASEQKWIRADKQPDGSPNEVTADPHHAGRFYIAAEGGGILRSEDSGATWSNVFKGSSRHVAVDEAVPDRVAAGLADGIVISRDGGLTWTNADLRLPYRFQPIVAFAGDRLLAGTVGNGCFWMPLSAAAEKEVAARPVPRAYRTAPALAAPILANGSMSEGGEAPAGWEASWKPQGLRLLRDAKEFRQGPASFLLQSEGGRADGTVSKVLTIPPDAHGRPLVVGGWIRSGGRLELASLSIYADVPGSKSGLWEGLVNAPATPDWMEFSRSFLLPPGVEKIRLQLSLKGEGGIWLDELNIALGEVWKDPK